jgi:hypothetical protein
MNKMGGACGTYGKWGAGGAYGLLVGRPDGKRPLGKPRGRWSIILKWIFKKWDGEAWIGFSGTGQGQLAGACESSNEPLGSMKCRESLD